jgi:hypothetical protein
MKRFIVSLLLASLMSYGAIVLAGYGAVTCVMKAGYGPTDSTFNVVGHSGNSRGRSSEIWRAVAHGDTVDFTFYSPEGNFTWRIAPGDSADGWTRHAVDNMGMPIPVDSVLIDRKTQSAEAMFYAVIKQ